MTNIASNLIEDRWRGPKGPGAFEAWYFDALSDDGSEAVTVTFYDDNPFTPRYFLRRERKNGQAQPRQRVPAVAFVYWVDGEPAMASVNEFGPNDFESDPDTVGCRIGQSSFALDQADYGSGFVLHLQLTGPRKRRIAAEFEWLPVETELPTDTRHTGLDWNVMVPRADVSGRISVQDRSGRELRLAHFRGTGYHDHLQSAGPLRAVAGRRIWGRAHFVDCTAVFQHISLPGQLSAETGLTILQNGCDETRKPAAIDLGPTRRDRYGMAIPSSISLTSDDNAVLEIKTTEVINSGFFQVKMLCEATLHSDDRNTTTTTGIVEFTEPGRLKNPISRWLAELGMNRNGP